jgi:WD40 repeat protein
VKVSAFLPSSLWRRGGVSAFKRLQKEIDRLETCTKDLRCLQTLEGHNYPVYSVAFSPNSTRLTSASDDSTVKIWDASSGVCLQTLNGHSRSICAVAFSPDSTRLASASHDRTIKIWNASSGACLQMLEGHSDAVMESLLFKD